MPRRYPAHRLFGPSDAASCTRSEAVDAAIRRGHFMYGQHLGTRVRTSQPAASLCVSVWETAFRVCAASHSVLALQAEQQFPCRPVDAMGRLSALETRGHSRVCLRREFWRCGHTVYMTVYVRSEDFGSVDIQFTGLCMSVAGVSAPRTYSKQGCVCLRLEYWLHGHTESKAVYVRGGSIGRMDIQKLNAMTFRA